MEGGKTRRAAAGLFILALAFAVVALSFASIHPLTQPTLSPTEEESKIFYYFENTTFRIDGSGDAKANWIMEMPASEFTDLNVLSFTGGTIGGTPVHGTGRENARQMYVAELKGSYATFGQEIEVTNCDLVSLEVGNDLQIKAEWTVRQLAHWEDGVWKVVVEPVDLETYTSNTLNQIKDLQGNLSLLSKNFSGTCQLNLTSTMTYILPNGAEITNSGELNFEYSIDFGGGTRETCTVRVVNAGGIQAVVMEDLITITSKPISISTAEFLENTRFITIEYAGVPPPVDFVDSVAGVAVNLKFGREKSVYTVVLDGVEVNLTPYQLLYYSALQLLRIQENDARPLLQSGHPLAVASPKAERGSWGTFLQTFNLDDLTALARDVCGQIEATRTVPESLEIPIGRIRPKDALYTFLKALSYYQEQKTLPSQLKFLPVPSGNLEKSGFEVPAHLAYFTLGEKYVVTGTDRVKQIITELKQTETTDRDFAENACSWVYGNITYPSPLVLGWFTSEEVLEMKSGKCLDKANLYLAIARTAGLPARRVSGFLIFDQVGPPFTDIAGVTPDGKYLVGHAWTEVYIFGEGWRFADSTAGYFDRPEYADKIYSRIEETWPEVLAQYETVYGDLF
ncbi:MAG: transglutaminase-like domain-containing protein [Candidatus Hadarchaeum sp.]|uniref:transglutaminase-like domain-containing protein n=1 Tax=Candidatus Hadarchaeum sp. TaxID=2883567 RepID=UPI003D0B37C0